MIPLRPMPRYWIASKQRAVSGGKESAPQMAASRPHPLLHLLRRRRPARRRCRRAHRHPRRLRRPRLHHTAHSTKATFTSTACLSQALRMTVPVSPNPRRLGHPAHPATSVHGLNARPCAIRRRKSLFQTAWSRKGVPALMSRSNGASMPSLKG